MKLPILYKAAKKGENVQWSIEAKGDSYIETYGRVGGKMQTNVHKCYVTNAGRANERTAKEQAEMEAKAKWISKVDKGYREDQKEVDDVPLLPMLAHSFKDKTGKVVTYKGTYPVYCQPKLNGLRCIAKTDGFLLSRGGKEWTAPKHISEQVRKLGLKYPIDGELYLHAETLQDITSWAKKDHGDGTTQKLNLVIYDVVMPGTFGDRYDYYNKNIPKLFQTDDKGMVAQIETVTCNSEAEVLDYEKECVKLGYEGCMVRTIDSTYEANHRSNKLLKVKSFQDDEFKVIGASKAQNGKVIWICQTKDGKDSFECYHRCNLEKGQWYWENREKFINKKLTVKYFEIIKETNKPQFPVGLAFRDEKDL